MDTSDVILIVDGNPATRDALAHPLIQHGYRVQAVANSRTALELARVLRPGVIFCDWNTSLHDGTTLWQEIEAVDRFRFTSFILTFTREEHDPLEAGEAAPDAILARPFCWLEVEARLRQARQHSAYRRGLSTFRHDINNALFALSGNIESTLNRLQTQEFANAQELTPRLERALTAAQRIQSLVQTLTEIPLAARPQPAAEPSLAEARNAA